MQQHYLVDGDHGERRNSGVQQQQQQQQHKSNNNNVGQKIIKQNTNVLGGGGGEDSAVADRDTEETEAVVNSELVIMKPRSDGRMLQ